jgi:hypothetical protein
LVPFIVALGFSSESHTKGCAVLSILGTVFCAIGYAEWTYPGGRPRPVRGLLWMMPGALFVGLAIHWLIWGPIRELMQISGEIFLLALTLAALGVLGWLAGQRMAIQA